jgi:hypothetical protein
VLATNNNAQKLITINKNTALVTSELKSVIYNGGTHATSGAILSDLLYTRNVIDFKSLTNNAVTFNLGGLPTHKRIYVRLMAYTDCSGSENTDLTLTLTGSPATVSTVAISATT